MTQQQTVTVPLLALSISPRNVRRTKPARIEELAALIKSQGLLQNLVVVLAKPTKGVDQVGYGVVGGGRRLRALQLLARQGDIAEDFPVPCQVVPDDQAEEASVAENSGREAMHPADEFDAFKRMHDAGSTAEDIAARFGVVPAVVTRRLKLANVAPKLLEVYRAGGMSLDQVMALTITDDHKLQVKAWGTDGENRWYREPHSLKSKLTAGTVATNDSAKARFIGLAAYEAAGGVVIRDLFDETGGGYMADEDLLDRLFTEKLEAEGEKLRSEGWSFVIVQPEPGYLNTYKYGRSKPTVRELTAEERSELNELNGKIEELAAESEQFQEAGDYERSEAIDDQVEALEAKRDTIQAGLMTYTDRQKKKAGAMVGVTHNGLAIERGLIQPVAAKPGATSAGAEPVAKPVHSDSLMRRLSAHRTAALAAHLLEAPRVALDLLCSSLATRVFYIRGYLANGVHIVPDDQLSMLRSQADDMEASKAWSAIHEYRDHLVDIMPEDPKDLFAWTAEQSIETVLEILCYCTAVTLDARTGQEDTRPLSHLQEAIGLDMANWWQPTQAGYFKHIKKDHVLNAIADAGGKDAIADLAKLKKGQLDARAEDMLKDTGWIPTVLRAPKDPA